MAEFAKPRVIGFNHVALEVGDINEALALYGRLFRFELRGKSTKRSEVTASLMSPPRAASCSRSATWRQVLCWRRSAGRRLSMARMSPSVRSVMMVGSFSGRGSLRDQSGRANSVTPHTTQNANLK